MTRFITALELHKEDYKLDQRYGRVIAIVQSSGSGKSRLVRELSKKVSTTYDMFKVYI